MLDTIRISVVVPVYNVKDFVPHAIQSLKAQTFKELECIIVDDGTTDGTSDVIRNEIGDDSRFRHLKIEHSGYGRACNEGIRNASGNYVAIYEPDDLLEPDFYECLAVHAQEHPDVDVFRYNGFYKLNGAKKSISYDCSARFTEKEMKRYGYKRIWRFHPSVFNGMYKKSFILEHKIAMCETEGASYQDVPFMVSLFYSNPLLFVINQAKYLYVLHKSQSIKFPAKKLDAVFRNWELERSWMIDQGCRNKGYYNYKMLMHLFYLALKIDDSQDLQRIYSYVAQKHRSVFFHLSRVTPLYQRLMCRFFYLMARFRQKVSTSESSDSRTEK